MKFRRAEEAKIRAEQQQHEDAKARLLADAAKRKRELHNLREFNRQQRGA